MTSRTIAVGDLSRPPRLESARLTSLPPVASASGADLPGPTPDVCVYSRENVQRNLYRIPLP